MSTTRIPKLCRHKRSGKAYVTDPATGGQVPMGPHGSEDARRNYEAWVRQFLRRGPAPARAAPVAADAEEGPSVCGLAAAVLSWAKGYYRKDGEQTGECNSLRTVMAAAVSLFADLPAARFGPSQFRAVRQLWLDAGHARSTINEQAVRLRRCWRWAVEHELVPPECLTALKAVTPLKAGRTTARETEPILAAPLADVEKTLPHLRPTLRALAQVQLYGAMRPAEARILRPRDLDRTQDPWLYTPRRHKTEHRGRRRRVWLGPKAQAVLGPLLSHADPDRPLFRNRRGRAVTPGDYSRAVKKACLKAGVPAWQPRQLRKTQSTAVRAALGPEAARVVLDHAMLQTMEIYAERDGRLARKAATMLG